MTSVVDNVSRIFQFKNNGEDLQVLPIFISIFNQQEALVDLATEEVSIELWKGNRKVAPLISRDGITKILNEMVTLGRAGTDDYLCALVEQELKLRAVELNKRMPGEDPFIPSTKEERGMFAVQKLLTDSLMRVLRKLEILAQQSFLTGEMNLKDDGTSKLIFPRDASLKNATVTTSWATAASATPWKDLGDMLRNIIETGQVRSTDQNTFMMADFVRVENLKNIYRSQKGDNVEAQLFYEYDFNRVSVPPALAFLVDAGATYVGRVKTEWGQNWVHIFSSIGMYDNGTSTVDYLSGETVSLCVYSPTYFKTYFGAGTKMPGSMSFYEKTLGDYAGEEMAITGEEMAGNSNLPARAFMDSMYPLEKNEGIGGCVQVAPIFAPLQVNSVGTIDTETTA